MALSKKTLGSLMTTAVLAFSAGFSMGALGGGATEPSAVPVTPPSSSDTVFSAQVVDQVAPRVYKLQAHVWTDQHVNTTACVGEVVYAAEKPACNTLVQTSTGGAWTSGQIVDIFNVRSLGDNVDNGDVVLPAKLRSQDKFAGPVTGKVVSLLDGDTFGVAVEIWPGHTLLTDVRVLEIDTPEKGGNAECDAEKALALRASAETRALIEGKMVTISDIEPDKYGGRVLGNVTTADGVNLAQHLIDKGLAKPYDGGTKQSWCPAVS